MDYIHSSASIHPRAQLGNNVRIGPFCVVEADVVLGDGCELSSHVVIHAGTRIGSNNRIFPGAILGGEPQHLRAGVQQGGLEIGDGNTLREHVTVHRGLEPGANTIVGNYNLLMVNAHVAHDCELGDHTILANNVMLAGHVCVESRAYLSGGVGVHQFCRIGGLAMVGGPSRVVQDVPPFVTVDARTGKVVGLNLVGLRRAGMEAEEICQLKEAYRVIYRRGLRWVEVRETLQQGFTSGPAAALTDFLSHGERGFVQERRTPKLATIRLHRPAEDSSLENPTPSAQADPLPARPDFSPHTESTPSPARHWPHRKAA